METDNKIKRNELWHKIYDIVKQIPREETTEDAVDATMAATEIEELFQELKSNPETFEDAARPLMEHMERHQHPHMVAIVESNKAHLLEGKKTLLPVTAAQAIGEFMEERSTPID